MFYICFQSFFQTTLIAASDLAFSIELRLFIKKPPKYIFFTIWQHVVTVLNGEVFLGPKNSSAHLSRYSDILALGRKHWPCQKPPNWPHLRGFKQSHSQNPNFLSNLKLICRLSWTLLQISSSDNITNAVLEKQWKPHASFLDVC